MDPHDSPPEAAFRAEARAFLEANAQPLPATALSLTSIVAEWSPQEEVVRVAEAKRWQAVKHAAGWAGIAWPKEYGGRGGTLIENLIFQMEEAAFDVADDPLVVGLGWCGPAVLQHGTEEQRQRLLPPLLRGEELWCQLFSEPGAGSDLAGLATRAVSDGDEWVIDGQKVWTTFAHRADWGLCIARHDPDAPRNVGLTAFMVDMTGPGVTARPIHQITNSSNFNEVFLDGVRVPDALRIGAVGDGWRVVVSTFMWERFNLIVGGSRVLPGLADLLRSTGASRDPRIRQRYVDLYIRAESLRFTVLRMMTALSRGQLPGPEGSLMKLVATNLLSDVFELALDVMGPEGMGDGAVDAWQGQWHAGFCGAPGMRIGGGTDAIQRNIIAERVLGLPRDPRPERV
ncbi:MAG: acyl-CoA dehydrogenase family protein [Actinomycetota bacterium]|nr:acyl-CoA dehydrogenase family protein [Actinomycetota bacterium]